MPETRKLQTSKIIIPILLLALLVIMYFFPVVTRRNVFDIITRSASLDFSKSFFLVAFLPLFLIIYLLVRGLKAKNLVLLCFSLLFISWSNPYYLLLFLLSSLSTYILSKSIFEDLKNGDDYFAHSTLIYGISMHILILFAFGFSNSYIFGLKYLFRAGFSLKSLAIPIGIVFYSLSAISLLVDTFNGLNLSRLKYMDVALYMCMFPKLLIGPFDRAYHVINELHSRSIKMELVGEGLLRFLIGLLKKVVIADNIYYLFERMSKFNPNELSTLSAWLGAIALLFAITFAFSGYSDMAIGLGRVLGFNFTENIKSPLLSASVVGLKKRFMISWFDYLREYLYLPLSRRTNLNSGISIKACAFVAFVFSVLMGFDGRFIIAGLFFAVVVLVEYNVRGVNVDKKRTISGGIYTKVVMAIGAVIWSSKNIISAAYYIRSMFFLNGRVFDLESFYFLRTYFVIFVLLTLICYIPKIKKLIRRKVARS